MRSSPNSKYIRLNWERKYLKLDNQTNKHHEKSKHRSSNGRQSTRRRQESPWKPKNYIRARRTSLWQRNVVCQVGRRIRLHSHLHRRPVPRRSPKGNFSCFDCSCIRYICARLPHFFSVTAGNDSIRKVVEMSGALFLNINYWTHVC